MEFGHTIGVACVYQMPPLFRCPKNVTFFFMGMNIQYKCIKMGGLYIHIASQEFISCVLFFTSHFKKKWLNASTWSILATIVQPCHTSCMEESHHVLFVVKEEQRQNTEEIDQQRWAQSGSFLQNRIKLNRSNFVS